MSRRALAVGPPPPTAATRVVTVTAAAPSLRGAVSELWDHRELVYFLAWRDVRVRYKQATLGFAWALLRPLLLMGVFTFVFSQVKTINTGDVPYPVFAFVGLLFWLYFSTAMLTASESLVSSANLVSKTYFPRLALPLAALLAQLPDLAVGGLVLIVMMLVTGVSVGPQLLLLPVVLLLLLGVTAAVGIGLAAVNVSYRDVKHAVPFLTQLGIWITPVAYPASLVSEKMRLLLALNPMAGLLELARWCVLGTKTPSVGPLALSLGVGALTMLGGLLYFRRAESTFADVI